MHQIFNFIWKNYAFFLFIILQFICFTLIIQHNNYHRAAFINKTNDFFGQLTEQVDGVYNYFSLASVNRSLAKENALLREKQQDAFFIADRNFIIVEDTIYQQKYKYRTAKVINNSIHKRRNYITLNKGSQHGIKKDMGVISADGIIGIITGVSQNYATVMSVLNANTKISAKIKRLNHMGSLVWDGVDYRKASLNDIPLHVTPENGDSIVTSGFSAIFPENIFIGTINNYSFKEADNFFTIEVDLGVDFNNLSYVYVIENLMRHEQQYLENQTLKE